jgi:hypothetical protein
VKLCMVSSLGQEMARTKTTTRRGQPNPLYKEMFLFQVSSTVDCLFGFLVQTVRSLGGSVPTERSHPDGVRVVAT